MTQYILSDNRLTFAGQKLAAELYDPAVGTLIGWLEGGEIVVKSRYGPLPQRVVDAAMTNWHLREDIAVDTFVSALPGFLRNVEAGVYDPNRGTTQLSYFVGACRNRVGDVIRARQHIFGEVLQDTAVLLRTLQDSRAGFDRDLEETDGLAAARDILLRAPHDLRKVLLLRVYDGVTITQAAKRLGLNPTTVRTHLFRFKRKLVALHLEGKIVIPEGTALSQWIDSKVDDRPVPDRIDVAANAWPPAEGLQ
ncbi:RNA polymerase sigma factor [Nocardia fluminea]|uniref:RNA polymerase sigma factor n=1 Tax=Nocardia fluminea TaxID=134984 RepID=UPI003424F88A